MNRTPTGIGGEFVDFGLSAAIHHDGDRRERASLCIDWHDGMHLRGDADAVDLPRRKVADQITGELPPRVGILFGNRSFRAEEDNGGALSDWFAIRPESGFQN